MIKKLLIITASPASLYFCWGCLMLTGLLRPDIAGLPEFGLLYYAGAGLPILIMLLNLKNTILKQEQ